MDPATKQFWLQLEEIGKEVLAQGRLMGFGTSLVETKFQHGTPSIVIRTMAKNSKFDNNKAARESINAELDADETNSFDGARTFTVVYRKGAIERVLIDEYSNRFLK